MLKKLTKNELLPASAFFLLLCAIFFFPVFWGRIPLPADLIVGGYFPWLDYKWGTTTGVPVKNSLLTDAVSITYPLKFVTSEIIKRGEFPLWNPLMFGGTPLAASLPLGLYFPTMIFHLIWSVPVAWTLQVIAQVFLGLTSMYFLMRHLKADRLSSIFASIAYAFGGFSMIWLEWNTHVATSAFLPLLILFEDKLISTGKLKWGVFLSFALALQIFAGYFPVTIFSLFAMFIWGLFKFSKQGIVKVGVFVFLGLALSSVLLFPVVELFRESQRKFEVLDPGSIFVPFQYLINFLAPDFFGNPSTKNFWGVYNYTNVASYTGIVAFAAALLGVAALPWKRETRFALTLLGLTISISTPNPLSEFLYRLGLWGGSSMTMNRALFLANFAISLLAGFGMSQLSRNFIGKALKISTCLFFAMGVLAGLVFWCSRDNPNLLVSAKNLILPTLLALLCLGLFLIFKIFRFDKRLLQAALIVLIALELFRFGWKFNSFSPAEYLYPETPLTGFLKQTSNVRFVSELDVFPANMWVPSGLESIAGYDSVYPLAMAKIIAAINSGNTQTPPQTKNGVVEHFTSRLLDVAGSQFVVTLKRDGQDGIKPSGRIDPVFGLPRFKEVFNEGSVVVMENTNSLPRAYLTPKVIKRNDLESLELLLNPDFPVKNVSISPDVELDGQTDSVSLAEYSRIANNRSQVRTESPAKAMLVTLDSFYPGWKASIDGVPAQIHKVNFGFRGVVVPEGKHVVEYYYLPESLKIGVFVSVLSAAVLLGILGLYKT